MCIAAATAYIACTPAASPSGGGGDQGGGGGGGGAPVVPVRSFAAYDKPTGNPYFDRFIAMWNDIHNPKNGYFSPKGIPYHSVETLIAEAPDYGHETTSEAYSYYIWLEALYGRITKDWSYLNEAWANAEAYIIPNDEDQPTTAAYNPSSPAQFQSEPAKIEDAPVALQPDVPTGSDPLFAELQQTYGTASVYAMHWLIDVDNWYGFGRRGDGKTSPAFINTFQRGPHETVFTAIPQPNWENFKFGGSNGYLDLFAKQDSYAQQWRYSDAPDADARAIQAVYWAKRWADEAGNGTAVAPVADKAAKMGDYLRYAMFDKYFKPIGCQNLNCRGAKGRGAEHYLLSWFYAWGGSIPGGPGDWAWRIGSSASHQGYQNPMAAYALSNVPAFKPKAPSALGDWGQSLKRQLEFYRWLQSAEGGIAGGVTNSIGGDYEAMAPGTPTFYGLPYQESPVFLDPPSNEWFGFEVWSMERVAEFYYVTADKRAETIVGKFVQWMLANIKLNPDGGYSVPSTIKWSGKPSASWSEQSASTGFDPKDTSFNSTLHVTVQDGGEDPGTTASVVKTLAFWAARSGDKQARSTAKELLDRLWKKYRDDKGVGMPEDHGNYKEFMDKLYLPPGWSGKMPNGDPIAPGATFLSIRSKYKQDPAWPAIDAYIKGGAQGPQPKITYHRFWAQSDVAIANATYGWLFPETGSAPASTPAAAAAPDAKKPAKTK